MKKKLLILIFTCVICLASGDPCTFPILVKSNDIVFIGKIINEELLEKKLKSTRNNVLLKFTKLKFTIDTTIYGSLKDTIQVIQLLDLDGYENFIVGAQYCMHVVFTKNIAYLFDTITINEYLTSRCQMHLNMSYVNGVPIQQKEIEKISLFCKIPEKK